MSLLVEESSNGLREAAPRQEPPGLPNSLDMSAPGYETLRERLKRDERLIWSGYPRQDLFIPRPTRWLMIVAPSVAIGTSVLANILSERIEKGSTAYGFTGAVIFFSTIISIFAWLSVLGCVRDQWRRGSTVYGLTDHRAIVVSGTVWRRERSVRLATITTIELIEHPDRIGTIRCISRHDGWYRQNRRGEIKAVPLFRGIVDPRHVHALLPGANGDQPARLFGRPPAIQNDSNLLHRIEQD